jgi:hypothetical protein
MEQKTVEYKKKYRRKCTENMKSKKAGLPQGTHRGKRAASWWVSSNMCERRNQEFCMLHAFEKNLAFCVRRRGFRIFWLRYFARCAPKRKEKEKRISPREWRRKKEKEKIYRKCNQQRTHKRTRISNRQWWYQAVPSNCGVTTCVRLVYSSHFSSACKTPDELEMSKK